MSNLSLTAQQYAAGQSSVLPVYVCERTLAEIIAFLGACVPNEGIVKLFGFDCTYDGSAFARVTDWFAGEQVVTPVTATFTDRGLREIELARRDRYPDRDARPIEVGIAHSHPFGHEPSFSSVDVETFTTFPYGPDNVHLLVDPTAGYAKAYVGLRRHGGRTGLKEVSWAVYAPAGH